jgi:hypothetical protein
MRIEIILDDPGKCTGCPCVPCEDHPCHAVDQWLDSDFKTGRYIRPSVCVEMYGK